MTGDQTSLPDGVTDATTKVAHVEQSQQQLLDAQDTLAYEQWLMSSALEQAIQDGEDTAIIAGTAAADASAAQTAADNAAQDAATAAGIASGKADILIQASEPPVAMRKDATLWIDTTGGANTPKRWIGGVWQVVTDKAATDAAAAAAAAMSRANDAHALAGTANANANLAITSANGKNTINRSTVAPSGTGTAGDVWWRFSDSTYTRVIGQWTYSGSAWQQNTLSHETIASVDIGVLTVVGQATLAQAVVEELWAQVVRSRKMTTDMLLVGAGENQHPDGYMTEAAAWDAEGYWLGTGGYFGGGRISFPATTTDMSYYQPGSGVSQLPYCAPVEPGKPYRVRVYLMSGKAATAGHLRVNVQWLNSAGAVVDTSYMYVEPGGGPAKWVEGLVTAPSTATYAKIGFWKSSGFGSFSVGWHALSITSAVDSSLVVDGGITARHLAATLVLASTIIAGNPSGAHVELTGSGIALRDSAGQTVLTLTPAGISLAGWVVHQSPGGTVKIGLVDDEGYGAEIPGVGVARTGAASRDGVRMVAYPSPSLQAGIMYKYGTTGQAGSLLWDGSTWTLSSSGGTLRTLSGGLLFNNRTIADQDTGWLTIGTFGSGWGAVAAQPPAVRYRDGWLMFRGAIEKGSGNSGFENAFALPAAIKVLMKPSWKHIAASAGSGGVAAKLQQEAAGSSTIQCFCPGTGYQLVPISALTVFVA